MSSLQPDWVWGTAEGARRAVLEAGSNTTFREKLEWLERAEEISLRMQRTKQNKAKKKS